MSIPFLARTWTLNDTSRQLSDYAPNPGAAGLETQTAGLLSYHELCLLMESSSKPDSDWSGLTIRRDNNNASAYAFHGKEWISYEDPKTCAQKARNATTEGFGGIVAYAINDDDFQGDCKSGTKFPLLHAINSALNHEDIKEIPYPTTQKPSTTTNLNFICRKEGIFRDLINCHKYHICLKTDIPGLWEDQIERCPNTHGYDEISHKCISKQLIPGCL